MKWCLDNGHTLDIAPCPRTYRDNARQQLAEKAIEEGCTHIFFIDDDMLHPPDIVQKLMEYNKDIVSGLYFTRGGHYHPLLMKRAKLEMAKYEPMYEYPKGLVEVDATGGGCLLIKTDVFKKLKKPWFVKNHVYGEDTYFCELARRAGFKIFVDTNLVCGHLGDKEIIDEDLWLSKGYKSFVKKRMHKNSDEELYTSTK